jgi:hypothetical protein
MAYTEADLAALDAAIAELEAGQRVNRASSGDKMIDYAPVTLAELMKKRVLMLASISGAAGRKSCYRVSTSKGI